MPEQRKILWDDNPGNVLCASAVGFRNSVSRVWQAQIVKNQAGSVTWGVQFMSKYYQRLNGSGIAETIDDAKESVQAVVNQFHEFWYNGTRVAP